MTTNQSRRRMRICLSVDFDALSGYLGTGHDANNTISDYSAGHLSANIGVPRLLKLFKRHGIADKVTWFIPGHSAETYPKETDAIVRSGAEIGLHGYSHEGAYAMTEQQEHDVLHKCIEVITHKCNGRRPVGYRAPLYQLRNTTITLLQKNAFWYDSSMNAHDSLPYYLMHPFPDGEPIVPDYSKPASTWMKPTVIPAQPPPGSQEAQTTVVEIPTSWYTEDMTPLGFYPYTASTQGYVSTDVVEKMWMDRFDWIWEHESFVDDDDDNDDNEIPQSYGYGYGSIYPMIWHPESAGRAHIVGMIDRVVAKLVRKAEESAGEITFETMESVARSWRARPARSVS